MSLLIDQAIRTQLIADIQAAWPIVEDRILSGVQRVVVSKVPYAVIRLVSCTMSGDSGGASMTDVEQEYTWHIAGKFKLPETENIETAKSDYANLLIAELMADKVYAGVAYLPIVREVFFDENEDTEDGKQQFFEIIVEFSCKCAVTRVVSS